MPDVFSKKKRSWVMSRVKQGDTKPEIIVRKILHRMGYRFRLRPSNLPGKPDIVLPRHKKVVFVHGCFWHGHKGCKRAARPESNKEFWEKKLNTNMERDKKTVKELRKLGWRTLTVWQCWTKDTAKLEKRLAAFLKL